MEGSDELAVVSATDKALRELKISKSIWQAYSARRHGGVLSFFPSVALASTAAAAAETVA